MLLFNLILFFQAFVDSNPNIKWCPFPGCGRAVKLPDLEDRTKKVPADTSRAVDCGNGHYFCWYATCQTYYHSPWIHSKMHLYCGGMVG